MKSLNQLLNPLSATSRLGWLSILALIKLPELERSGKHFCCRYLEQGTSFHISGQLKAVCQSIVDFCVQQSLPTGDLGIPSTQIYGRAWQSKG